MGLQDLENPALAPLGFRISPSEADHRANTGLRENGRSDSHLEFFQLRPKTLLDHGAHVLRFDVTNSVFQLGEGGAQSRSEMLVSRDDLAQFLEPWSLGNEP